MDAASVGTPVLWIGFLVFVFAMLALDLGVFNRKIHAIRFKEALAWSMMWISLALLFDVGVYFYFGAEQGLQFLTGYVIEKALSVDNLFVFVVIFGFFRVPASLQHRVLFWGILGALVMRAAFIFAGTALIHQFHWTIYVFGAILVFTGIKLLFQQASDVHPERNPVVRLLSRVLPIATSHEGPEFFIKQNGRWLVTSLFIALLTIEVSDIVFAVDSIPAVLAITTDPFIVFTSNIFAILGLRSLYFLLASMLGNFRFLHFGLAAVLLFVGAKMIGADLIEVPIGLSLGVVGGLLVISVGASLLFPSKDASPPPSSPLPPA